LLNSISEALRDIKKGKPIIVVDDENRENEGDFLVAAEKTTPEIINYFAKEGRGLICTPVSVEIADQLNFHPMTASKEDADGLQLRCLGRPQERHHQRNLCRRPIQDDQENYRRKGQAWRFPETRSCLPSPS
jgi:hypothetical protein